MIANAEVDFQDAVLAAKICSLRYHASRLRARTGIRKNCLRGRNRCRPGAPCEQEKNDAPARLESHASRLFRHRYRCVTRFMGAGESSALSFVTFQMGAAAMRSYRFTVLAAALTAGRGLGA